VVINQVAPVAPTPEAVVVPAQTGAVEEAVDQEL
jgi:hypothetical protein